ncbi:hypothetical protein SISSUDRAFT_1037321 [Sistotremastrum suecicum HHB10207 ss-3]|uniref:Uncharacterized protein n=1 Tax=Sistotremastrum suecicum HHB10207 ss-3 TaxID=1314776 RepID=A0A165YB24_9AGAM|nr:hypothetical protein SISSUDRAFT_1037321 [Sistotremastrum suecicum HHB10207 ss-3]
MSSNSAAASHVGSQAESRAIALARRAAALAVDANVSPQFRSHGSSTPHQSSGESRDSSPTPQRFSARRTNFLSPTPAPVPRVPSSSNAPTQKRNFPGINARTRYSVSRSVHSTNTRGSPSIRGTTHNNQADHFSEEGTPIANTEEDIAMNEVEGTESVPVLSDRSTEADATKGENQERILAMILSSERRNRKTLKSIAEMLRQRDGSARPREANDHIRPEDEASENWRSWKKRPARRDRDTLDLQKTVRMFLQRLESRDDDDTIFPDQPTDREVAQFQGGNNPGPTMERFRLHYDGVPCSPWNTEARELFQQVFLETYEEEEPGWNLQAVHDALYARIRTRRSDWLKDKKALTPEEKAIKRELDLRETRRRTRRINLWNLRLTEVRAHPGLAEAEEVLVRLGALGMSDDESEDDRQHLIHNSTRRPVYVIRQRTERASWVTKLLRVLDDLHYERRYPPGPERTRGGPPRERKTTPVIISKKRPMPDIDAQNWLCDPKDFANYLPSMLQFRPELNSIPSDLSRVGL